IVQERTGRVLPPEAWPALAMLREELALPLIAIESTSACYRSGLGALASPALPVMPDVLGWWGGAQTGYPHVAPRWPVPGALTLVSTWDGDELSLVREHHQLRAARHLDVAAGGRALDEALAGLGRIGATARGLGLYRVIEAGGHGTALADGLAARGLGLRRFPAGGLGVVPPLDRAS